MGMISLRDKRGQEGGGPGVTVGVIVAILVLVLLGFLVYYGYNAWQKGSLPWQKSTVSVAAQACEASCVGSDKYGYCSQDRIVELSATDFKKYEMILTNISGSNNKIKVENRKVTATCNEFAKEQRLADWSISLCSNIECSTA